MARRIFKYPLALPTDDCVFDLPQGAWVLSVQLQGGDPQLWAIVEDTAPSERRTFRWVATGEIIQEPIMTYVASIQFRGGVLVYHLFEVGHD